MNIRSAVLSTLTALLLALLQIGCQAAPSSLSGPSRVDAAAGLLRPGDFSAALAWRHLVALTGIGPRVTGTRGNGRARRYIRSQLERLGAEIRELRVQVETGRPGAREAEAVGLVAVLPGRSADRLLLAAAYDTWPGDGFDFVGANETASGAALVLELARASSQRPRPYTLMFVFLDGDSLSAPGPMPTPAMRHASALRLHGSAALVRHLHTEGLLESIRVAYFFARVGDEDLSISRDLRSHHVHREVFWESAANLGRLAAFPTNARLESPITGHRAFVDLGFSRVVAITDAHYGDGGDGDASPGSYSLTAEDSVEHCSAESLAAVGEVTLETLDRIAARLSRIDRFRGAPLVDPHTRAGN